MPSTKCIILRQRICFAKSRDKEMFIYAASGPFNLVLLTTNYQTEIAVYIYTECCVIMQVFCGPYRKVLQRQLELCVKTNSCVFKCKPDNKNRNPENL